MGGGAVAIAAGVFSTPLFIRARSKIRVGYIHVPSVDSHIWTGLNLGAFSRNGIELELHEFSTGPELFQAMIGGSLDMITAGAAISSFPARGQGRVFLVNNVELATSQLWVSSKSMIQNLIDLKGHQIATTIGTTAHVFLDTALRSVNLDPESDVKIVNLKMPDAVSAFISGAVEAVALWMPFDARVREKAPDSRKLIDASAFYPESAVVGGWAAREDYLSKNSEAVRGVIKAWVEANNEIIDNPLRSIINVHERYPNISLDELKNQFGAAKYFKTTEWQRLYLDGTVETWLQQVSNFFVRVGKIENPVDASEYFATGPFLSVVGT